LAGSLLNKAEFWFVGTEFESATLTSDHAVLLDHLEAVDELFVSSQAEDPDALLLELDRLAGVHFGGWRPLGGYLNQGYPSRRILTEGYGMLLRAPRSFADRCTTVLKSAGVRVDELFRGRIPEASKRALVLGRNFVVAEGFVFESRQS
jgi:hypothetical protein